MKRRTFVRNATLAAIGSVYITRDLYGQGNSVVYGHNNMKYKMDQSWCKADPLRNPVNDCHEMVQDSSGQDHFVDERDEEQHHDV